ncbi:hypothetical protein T4A_23 [Trichinella pseudospiralis]|uniref:Uncharacterized protein n=1 Tax=Trichinella pseudospiralis TaxID=6337 RepID=A0A0V1ANR3_TRIPS|nr:hypothetical protein T4A_23 [Trichinella pseudospiralis]
MNKMDILEKLTSSQRNSRCKGSFGGYLFDNY